VQFDPRRLALDCTAAARLGAVEPFSRCLFRALFVTGVSPLDDEACAALAREAGLDQTAFQRALDQPETAAALAATVEEAVARGVFGVPSFVLGDEIYFGNDRLVLLRHALLRAAAP
jgi:2-hydroxychromene-2-carboxylate isomerase